MHAFEASDERKNRLEDAQLNVHSLREAVIQGRDNDGHSRLGDDSKSNESLQGAYRDCNHFGVAGRATYEGRPEEVIGMVA